jgi:glycosyltransferase involved in cell wall biosynthesis
MRTKHVRVLYSFPHKIGAGRICYTAWQQVNGLAAAGAEVLLFPGAVTKPVAREIKVVPTLARGRFRIPYRLVGKFRALALHDYLVARRLEKLVGEVDIVHTWPMAAKRTLQAAAKLGIPTVLERPNAHTRFAYEVVQRECRRLGVVLPPGHEYELNEETLRQEEEEYRLATQLLCPSEFTLKTFQERGFERERLARHQYGFDEATYYPSPGRRTPEKGLTMLFVGVCAVRKGVHFALEAWLRSPACKDGTFLIAGDFLPAYRERLASTIRHPSVQILGHRNDIADLMRGADILVLPSIEEGFGLVIAEAMGCGCVPLISDACTEVCTHRETGLVHRAGDVDALTEHITLLYRDRPLLEKFRAACLKKAHEITWTAAGIKLLDVYREVIAMYGRATQNQDVQPGPLNYASQ